MASTFVRSSIGYSNTSTLLRLLIEHYSTKLVHQIWVIVGECGRIGEEQAGLCRVLGYFPGPSGASRRLILPRLSLPSHEIWRYVSNNLGKAAISLKSLQPTGDIFQVQTNGRQTSKFEDLYMNREQISMQPQTGSWLADHPTSVGCQEAGCMQNAHSGRGRSG